MGDRVTVTLTVRGVDEKLVEKIADGFAAKDSCSASDEDVELIEYTYHEINYTNLECEKQLQENKITYDKSWGKGDEYHAGTEYHRLTKFGETVIKKYENNEERLIELDDLVEAFESGSISIFVAEQKEKHLILPWNNFDPTSSETEEANSKIKLRRTRRVTASVDMEASYSVTQSEYKKLVEEEGTPESALQRLIDAGEAVRVSHSSEVDEVHTEHEVAVTEI